MSSETFIVAAQYRLQGWTVQIESPLQQIVPVEMEILRQSEF